MLSVYIPYIVVGVLAFLALVLGVFVYLVERKRRHVGGWKTSGAGKPGDDATAKAKDFSGVNMVMKQSPKRGPPSPRRKESLAPSTGSRKQSLTGPGGSANRKPSNVCVVQLQDIAEGAEGVTKPSTSLQVPSSSETRASGGLDARTYTSKQKSGT